MLMEKNLYEKAGFKCGLEIHIQLDTEKKLFCSCPNRRSSVFPIKIKRRIRASAGELGMMDLAALQEFLRGKTFSYAANQETSCLVEADEEPPHEMNREALAAALSVAKALNCAVPDEIHIMRKIVADGSAVSGFQRTALVGLNGVLDVGFGRVGISNLSLEEDSAAPVGRRDAAEYRLDRLGVPLIEIGTGPDIKTPAQARQSAERIGMLLLGKRMRGIGTIRQDLNVSIKGGARVEIKGVQELGLIETVIESEIKRQQSLIEIRNELAKRNAMATSPSIGAGGMMDATALFRNTQSNLVRDALKSGGSVFAGLLKGFAGLLKTDCGGKSFGKEMSSYAGVFGLGLIHSDELEKFPFLADDFARLRKEFSARENDLLFIVAGGNAGSACEAVLKRAGRAVKGVPEETRAANPDGTTSYMRPLPGSARMYPETDVLPIRISKEFLKKIKPPESAEARLQRLGKMLPRQMAEQMLRSEYLGLFEKITSEISKRKNIEPSYMPIYFVTIANTFTNILPSLSREGVPVENIPDEKIYDIFAGPAAVPKELLPELLKNIAKNPSADIHEILESAGAGRLSRKDAEKTVKEIIEKNRDALAKPAAFSIIMGEAMKNLRGQIDGRIVSEIVKTEIEEARKK